MESAKSKQQKKPQEHLITESLETLHIEPDGEPFMEYKINETVVHSTTLNT